MTKSASPKFHKFFTYLLTFCLTLGSAFAVPQPVQANTPSADYFWYTTNPNATTFTIRTAEQLRAFANIVNGTDGQTAFNFSGRNVNLGANIDLGYEQWVPISNVTGAARFAGTFNGQNFTISGLQINRNASNTGLFGATNGAIIRNLRVNGNVQGSSSVGGIIGVMTAGTIESVHFSGSVTGSSQYVGGIVGETSGAAAIRRCSNSANIFNTSSRTGGIVGRNTGTVSESFNTGNVHGNSDCAGGIVGTNAAGTIQNNYNTGNISSNSSGGTAGIAGESTGIVEFNYNTGNVAANGGRVGGIVGDNMTGAVTRNNVSLGAIASGSSGTGRIIGSGVTTNLSSNYARDIKRVGVGTGTTVTGTTVNNNGQNLLTEGMTVIFGSTRAGFSADFWTIPNNTFTTNSTLPTLRYNAAPTTPRLPAGVINGQAFAANLGSFNNTEQGMHWDLNTLTLTLRGVNIYADTASISALTLPAGTTIVLEAGTVNTIHHTSTAASTTVHGLNHSGLTITGSGTLNVVGASAPTGTGHNSGIDGTGTLTINNGTINATGGTNPTTDAHSYGIRATTLNINGGSVTARSGAGVHRGRGVNATTVNLIGGELRSIGHQWAFSSNVVFPNTMPHIAIVSTDVGGLSPILTRSYTRVDTHRNVHLMPFSGGNGMTHNPYMISSAADLHAISTRVNATTNPKTYRDEHLRMTNDIDLANVPFIPIGHTANTHDFRGNFNGDGYKITGLNIDVGTQFAGLFGYVITGGVVRNVGVAGNVRSTANTVGGIVGISNQGRVENSWFAGTVTGERNVGGLVGNNSNGTIQNCYNMAIVSVTGTGTGANVGGIAGNNAGSTGFIINCYNIGDVSGVSNVGGIAGWNDNASASIAIRNNVSLGLNVSRVSGSATSFGRILGFNNTGGTLSRNFGRRDMLVNGVTATGSHTSLHGGTWTIDTSSMNEVFVTGTDAASAPNFNTAVWNIPGGFLSVGSNLPTLTIMKDQITPTLPGIITLTLNRQNGIGGAGSITIPHNSAMLTGWTVAPTRDGYTFDGYWTEETGGSRVINTNGTLAENVAGFTNTGGLWVGTTNVTIHAQWIPDNFTITLDWNEGDEGDENVLVIYGQPMPGITLPTRFGFIFNGYFTASTGGVQYYNANGTSARDWDIRENTTLYAQWVSRFFTIVDTDEVENFVIKGSLDALFNTLATNPTQGITQDEIDGDEVITLTLTIREIADDETGTAQGADEIIEEARGRMLQFFDITMRKDVGGNTTQLRELNVPIQVIIDLSPELSGRTGYSVYRYHDNEVQLIGMNSTDGEFFTISRGTGAGGVDQIIINTKRFSTYAVVEHIMALKINEQESLDVQARIIEDKNLIYRIDIAWGAMKFEFNIDADEWVQDGFDDVNNKITVTNRSNAGVTVEFDIDSEIDMDIIADENEISRADTANGVQSIDAFLEISEAPDILTIKDYYEKIGIITVTITANG